MGIRTLAELLRVVAEHDLPQCLLHKVDGAWRAVSAAELRRRVRGLATTLDRWGVRPGDRVALMAENGVHWPVVDFATVALGAVTVPVYSTLLPEGAAYVVRDSGAKVAFVQGSVRLRGLRELAASLPAVERWVVIGSEAPEGAVEFTGRRLVAPFS